MKQSLSRQPIIRNALNDEDLVPSVSQHNKIRLNWGRLVTAKNTYQQTTIQIPAFCFQTVVSSLPGFASALAFHSSREDVRHLFSETFPWRVVCSFPPSRQTSLHEMPRRKPCRAICTSLPLCDSPWLKLKTPNISAWEPTDAAWTREAAFFNCAWC